MTQHAQIQNWLNDYVDGALPPSRQGVVEDHLAGCAECRLEAEALRGLLVEAQSLPREILPPRDLWEGIAARIQQPTAVDPSRGATPAVVPMESRRPGWRRWAPLAAAALVLVTLSSAATAYLLRAGSGTPLATLPAAPAQAARTSSALVAFRPTEMQYRSTVEALEAELAARRDQLAPGTVTVIEANLRIIDRAINEARAALEADPSNPELPLLLSGVYRKKVELLHSAVQLPRT